MVSRRLFRKVFVYISIFSIILQAIVPFSYVQLSSKAYAQEVDSTSSPQVTPTDTVTPTPVPTDVPAPTDTPVPTDTVTPTPIESGQADTVTPTPTPVDNLSPPVSSIEPAPVANPSSELQTVVEKECLIDQAIVDTANDNWNIDLEKGTAETKEKVKLGVKYVFPQENKVSVTFKCLPKDEGLRTPLKIQKVKVSDLNLPNDINPYGEFAYDITTGMVDGNFEYEITLPKPENKSVEVSYMEDPGSEVKTVDEGNTNQESDKIKVNSLDHFTIFFVSTTMSVYASFNGASQVTVYPSAPITVALQVTTSGSSSSNDWSSSQYLIEGSSWSSCDNSPNFTNSGTNTDTIGITAPSLVDTYDLSLRVYNSNDCTGASGTFAETTLTDAINVVVNTTITIPFTETFGSSNNPTVTNWYQTNPAEVISGSGDDAPTSGQFAKIGDDGWICRPFDATGITAVGLSYDWKGNANNSGDLGVVEYKAGGSCGDSSDWNNLASNPLNVTSWGNQIHTFLGNGLFHLRFRTSNAESGEFFRVDNVHLATVGAITIIKDTQPDDAQNFSFTTTGTGLSSFSLDDDANATLSNTKSFIGLSAGTYTVVEAAQAGFDLADLTCTDPTSNSTGNTGTRVATINLATNESVTCTFVNAKRGHVIVTKDAVPNDGQDFSFTNNFGNGNPASFNLDDDSNGTLSNTTNSEVIPGTYSVSEAAVSGWTSNGGVCSDGSPVNAIQVSAGETVTCTFTNNKNLPDLTAVKTNDVGGNATINQAFNWKIRVQNSGLATATFTNGQEILKDERQSTGVSLYGVATAVAGGGASGTVVCTASGTTVGGVGRDLTCTASGTVTIPVDGYFDISFSATPNASGTLNNPRGGSMCRTDRNTGITESDENNNNCLNPVTVAAVQPIANPELPQACGLDIALILDVSGSIDDTELGQMKTAVTGLVTALDGTPTEFSVTKFDTNASVVQAFIGNTATVNTAINSVNGDGYTNWEDGLTKGNSTLTNRADHPDLVIFASDGQPNTIGTSGSSTGNNASPDGSDAAMNPAITIANTIKARPARILGIGIGLNAAGTANMKEISGPNADTGSFTTSDLITTNFSTLATQLATFASDTCGRTVTVTKLIDADGNLGTVDDQTPAQGWTFDIGGQSGQVTDPQGKTPAVTLAVGSGYNVTETLQNGYSLLSASCTGAATNGSEDLPNTRVTGVQVANGNVITCTFINTLQKGHIIVNKVTDPSGDSQSFDFTTTGTGYSGFSLTDAAAPNNQEVLVGSYTVSETSVAGWDLTSATCNMGETPASLDVGVGETVTCTFTNTKLGSISGTKYEDADGNTGTTDDQTGILNWVIKLYNNCTAGFVGCVLAATTNTAANGSYSFTNLLPGYYQINEVVQAGWTALTSLYHLITLSPGESEINKNFANFHNISVSGQKFNDLDGSGTEDAGEPGLSGWTIQLYKSNGGSFTVFSTAITDSGGNYSFANLGPGEYRLFEVNQTGWAQTRPFSYYDVPVASGQNVTGMDFGNQRNTGTITIDKITNPLGSTQEFTFHVVQIDNTSWNGATQHFNPLPGGFSQTINVTDLTTPIITVPTGNYDLYEDVPGGWIQGGYICSYTTGARSGGGIMNYNFDIRTGENATCTFTNTQKGTIIIEKQTLPDGHQQTFEFTGAVNDWIEDGEQLTTEVIPGAHTVSETNPSTSGYRLISIACDDANSTGNVQTGTATFNIEAGEIVKCTFTNEIYGSISGYKWEDVNANGVWDTGETAQSGWEIFIDQNKSYGLDAGDITTTTDANGYYEFSVLPGEHWVFETVKSGWSQYAPYYTQGHSYFIINVTAGQTYPDNNFGNYRYAHIEGDKWNDLNGNGVWDKPTEPALFQNGLRYRVYKEVSPGVYSEVINGPFESSHYGEYVWVAPGTYWIAEYNIPAGWAQTYPDSNAPTVFGMRLLGPITLLSGESSSNNNLGNAQLGSIHGQKWNDLNGNHVQDEIGSLLSGWTMNLSKFNGDTYDQIATMDTSDGSEHFGWYWFEHLFPGQYKVCEELKTGWIQTYPVDPNCHTLTLPDGNSGGFEVQINATTGPVYNFGNQLFDPILTITKENNTGGASKAPGDTVGFTITISADSEGGPADNVKVIDLLPKGFTFNSGSWKVVSSDTLRGVNGDITSSLSSPTYASPGTWSLGHLNSGETLTLTYTATINGSQATGTYYDNAWAQGNPVGDPSNIILASAVIPGKLDGTFVGTEVAIVNGDQGGVDYKATSTQEVLGASTYLPATGEPTLWVIIAALLGGLGLGLLFLGFRLRRKYA